MPKKGYRVRKREWAEKLYYRWEFIRRNKAYQSDQAKFISLFGTWFKRRGLLLNSMTGHNWEILDKHGIYRGRASDYFMKKIAPYLEAFDRKWRVSWPCPPTYTFNPDDMNQFSGSKSHIRTNLRNCPVSDLSSDLRLETPIERLADEMYEFVNPLGLDKLPAKFAAQGGMPTHVENKQLIFKVLPFLGKERNYELFHRFMAEIRWPKKQRLSNAGRKRVRLKNYGTYLRVWDLKQANPSLTWSKLAKSLYPRTFNQYSSGTFRSEKNAAVQQVMDQYKSAERLIAGGFQEIR